MISSGEVKKCLFDLLYFRDVTKGTSTPARPIPKTFSGENRFL